MTLKNYQSYTEERPQNWSAERLSSRFGLPQFQPRAQGASRLSTNLRSCQSVSTQSLRVRENNYVGQTLREDVAGQTNKRLKDHQLKMKAIRDLVAKQEKNKTVYVSAGVTLDSESRPSQSNIKVGASFQAQKGATLASVEEMQVKVEQPKRSKQSTTKTGWAEGSTILIIPNYEKTSSGVTFMMQTKEKHEKER